MIRNSSQPGEQGQILLHLHNNSEMLARLLILICLLDSNDQLYVVVLPVCNKS